MLILASRYHPQISQVQPRYDPGDCLEPRWVTLVSGYYALHVLCQWYATPTNTKELDI